MVLGPGTGRSGFITLLQRGIKASTRRQWRKCKIKHLFSDPPRSSSSHQFSSYLPLLQWQLLYATKPWAGQPKAMRIFCVVLLWNVTVFRVMWRLERTPSGLVFSLLFFSLIIEKYHESRKRHQGWLQKWFPVRVLYYWNARWEFKDWGFKQVIKSESLSTLWTRHFLDFQPSCIKQLYQALDKIVS